jgi:hypothetical protein
LIDEISGLNELAQLGFPVVEIQGTTTHGGQPALVMRRYAVGSKQIVYEGASAHMLNERSLADLQLIRFLMEKYGLFIEDLQFLIGSDGRVVINDPLSAPIRRAPNYYAVDQLIDATLEQILTRKMLPGEEYTRVQLEALVGPRVDPFVMTQFLNMAVHPQVGFMIRAPRNRFMLKPPASSNP